MSIFVSDDIDLEVRFGPQPFEGRPDTHRCHVRCLDCDFHEGVHSWSNATAMGVSHHIQSALLLSRAHARHRLVIDVHGGKWTLDGRDYTWHPTPKEYS